MIYRVDRSRIESDPRWASVAEADRVEIAELIDTVGMIAAIKRYREVTGCGLGESKLAVESVLDVALGKRGAGPPCPLCGKPLRTKKAEQCFECGADWHKHQSAT
jgi:hypothetical protein